MRADSSCARFLIVAALCCVKNDYEGFRCAFKEIEMLNNNNISRRKRASDKQDIVQKFVDEFYKSRKNKNFSMISKLRKVYENIMLSNEELKKAAFMIFLDDVSPICASENADAQIKDIEAIENIYLSLAECFLSQRI